MVKIPIETRVARLAAKLPQAESEVLLWSWRVYRAMYSNDELEAMFESHRLDRELHTLLLTEQQRVFDEDLAEGEEE